ncbi:uncharacterized protein LOC126904556 [Daktulosphaira vitifoliae]|uniref:uncharacterized protein LOC126904556 n=1 Tax=Daktulosphaira vitifoliae TaxID=58002 RepID=UPI0021AA1A89|nr:uncharacterized protein LOC126904556 [Daktulosphaira vitifoliae]XP_050539630.1 uncharacterized protein LOC126904556 [Daktulosphaira vitifoliae]
MNIFTKKIILIFFLPFHNLANKALPTFVVHLMEVSNCIKNKQYKFINAYYNFSDDKENNKFTVLQDITPSLNLTSQNTVLTKNIGWKVEPVFSGKIISSCFFLKNDLTVIPLIREFVDIPKECPVRKGVRQIIRKELLSTTRPSLPFGCWMLKHELKDSKGLIVGCIKIVVIQSILFTLEEMKKQCH